MDKEFKEIGDDIDLWPKNLVDDHYTATLLFLNLS